MVSLYTVIMMNVIGIVEVFLPVVILYILHHRKKYKISSVVAGLVCYFIINQLVINNVFTILRVSLGDDLFFNEHVLLGLLLESLLSAGLLCPLMYLIIRVVRGGKWSIYDAAAMAVAFWMIPLIMDGGMQISTASILNHARSSSLEKLATEDYPLEMLQALVDSVLSSTAWELTLERIISIITQLVVLLILISLAVTIFYAVKRNKKSALFLAMGAHFLITLIVNGSSYYIGYWPSFALIVASGLFSFWYLKRFFRYFREQQAAFIRRKQEFKAEQHRKYQEELEAKKQLQQNKKTAE